MIRRTRSENAVTEDALCRDSGIDQQYSGKVILVQWIMKRHQEQGNFVIVAVARKFTVREL